MPKENIVAAAAAAALVNVINIQLRRGEWLAGGSAVFGELLVLMSRTAPLVRHTDILHHALEEEKIKYIHKTLWSGT